MEESGGHSRRRGHRRRRAAHVCIDTISQEESGESGLSRRRPGRSETRSQSRASSSAAPPVEESGESGLSRRRPGRSETRSQSRASSSAAPPVDGGAAFILWYKARYKAISEVMEYGRRPRSELSGAGGRTHVRQSVLYSDRPRHSRLRRQAQAQEHPTPFSSIDQALPSSDTPHFIPETSEEIYDDSELGRAIKDSPPFERLSLSDNTLFSPQPAEEIDECTREESSSELGKAVIDLPTIEALSLSDPPLLTHQTEADEETDDDWAELPTTGQTDLFFNRPKGLSRSMVLSQADSLFITVSNDDEERPKPYPDEDPEELLRSIKEYLDACPCIDLSALSVASDRIEAIENVNLDSHAAELGTKPPSVLTEQTSAAERHEASRAWMKEEVMLCFKKLVEISPDLVELEDYHLYELCHQCFNVESYDKVYHHYNFTVRMKMPNSADWTVELYFAEVKEIFRTKYYLCYPLDPNENGQCYACKNQGVEDLRHPAIDVFEMGSSDASACNLWYTTDD